MQPEVERDGATSGRTAADPSGQETYRRALRLLCQAYERHLAEMAAAVCEAEAGIAGASEFVLTEIENRFVHRLRDLQALIGSLRSQLYAGRPAPTTDELRCKQSELAARLARWLAEHPGAELLQVVVERTPEGDLQVIPIFHPGM